MRSLVVVVLFVVACDKSDKPTVPPSTPGSSTGSSTEGAGSAKAGSAHFTGRAESEPCNDVKDCTLRDNCGCSCEAVVLGAATHVACDETCGMNACAGYTLICDTALHRCGAIPKPPPP